MKRFSHLFGIAALAGALATPAAAQPSYELIDGGEPVLSSNYVGAAIASHSVVGATSSDLASAFLLRASIVSPSNSSAQATTLIGLRAPNAATTFIEPPLLSLPELSANPARIPFHAVAAGGEAIGSVLSENGAFRSFRYSPQTNSYTELAAVLGTSPHSLAARAHDITADGMRTGGESYSSDQCVDGSGGVLGRQAAIVWRTDGSIEYNLGNDPTFSNGQSCGLPARANTSVLDLSPNGRFALVGAGSGAGAIRIVVFDLSSQLPTIVREITLNQLGIGASAQATRAFVSNSGTAVLKIVNSMTNPIYIYDETGPLLVPTAPSDACELTSFSQRSGKFIIALSCLINSNPFNRQASFFVFDPIARAITALSMNRVFPNPPFTATVAEFQGVAVDATNGVAAIRQ